MLTVSERAQEFHQRLIELNGFDELTADRLVGNFILSKLPLGLDNEKKIQQIVKIASDISFNNDTSLLGEAILLAGDDVRRARNAEFLAIAYED